MRNKILFSLAILVSFALTAVFLFEPEIDVEIAEEGVQTRIAEQLPKTLERVLLTVTIVDLSVDFLATDKAHVTGKFHLAGLGFEGLADVDAVSGVEFRDGAFYLADMTLDDVGFTPTPATREAVEDNRSIARGILDKLGRDIEREEDGSEAALKRAEKRIATRAREAIRDHGHHIIASIPIYDLDDRGSLVRLAGLAVTSSRFTDTSAILSLSPSRFLTKVLAVLCALAIIVAFVLFQLGLLPSLRRSSKPGSSPS